MNPQKSPKKDNKTLRNVGHLSSLALEMGVTIYLGNFLGKKADTYFETNFLEEVVTLLAIFLSIYLIIRKVSVLNK
jgi:uncharacterized membrane protein YfcA